MTSPRDDELMRRAIALAAKGRGFVEPNPMVGAVVVSPNGEVVGEGFHPKFGGPHAEVVALDAAGDAARDGTLYVTLEPCCHFGKTPPCTDRVLASGVRRVVVAMLDPFPAVAGRGASILRSAGLTVEIGVQEEESRRLNAPYLCLLERGRPYVHAKWAMSIDGKIATTTGESKWISGEASRRHAHEFRGLVDGILVGVGTAIADDPMLTARPAGPRTAVRIVLDSHGRLPATAKLVRTAGEIPTIIVTLDSTPVESIAEHAEAGCEILRLPPAEDGRPSLGELLGELGRRRWTNLLVEGGAGVIGSFAASDYVDELRAYVAPLVIGGSVAPGPVGGDGFARLCDATRFKSVEHASLEGDLFVRATRTRLSDSR